MVEREAQCSCGQLRLLCRGEPAKVSLCHCRACQRRSGSAFGIAAFYPRDAVEVTGEARTYTRGSDAGLTITFHFCPTCGVSLFWEPERKPELLAVAVGGFADPGFPAPSQEVWTQCRHPWVVLPL